MDDKTLLHNIETLVEEEHALYNQGAAGHALTDAEQARLKALQVQLDRFWDLLRRRRAARDYGIDPDQEDLRDADTVENYRP